MITSYLLKNHKPTAKVSRRYRGEEIDLPNLD
jgi:hypothetical protein